MQDNEKISLKRRIDELEKYNKEQKELIFQFEEQSNAAEKKINALNQIHQDKVRNLMNSITILKKENAQLKNMNKEHKRSQLIEQLNQEIADQEIVIQVLRSIVNDDSRCDKQIVDALNKGPPQLKTPTREELKIQCKTLQNSILLLKEQLAKKQQDLKQDSLSQSSSHDMSQICKDLSSNQIRQLEEEKSNLIAEVQALIDQNKKLETLLFEKSQQITVLNEQKGNYIVLNKKYEQLQKQMEEYKKLVNEQDDKDIQKEVQMDEQKLLNKVQETKLESIEKELRAQINKIEIEKQMQENQIHNLQNECGKQAKRIQNLEKKLSDQEKELNSKAKELRERIQEFAKLEAQLKTEISNLKKQIDDVESTVEEKRKEISQNLQTIANLNGQIDQLQAKLQRAGTTKQIDDYSQDIRINKSIQQNLKKQMTSDDPKVLKQLLKQQQDFYEQKIQFIQSQTKNKQDEISQVSSNISNIVREDENNQQFDMMSSDISQFEKKQEDYDVDSNLEEQNIPSDIHSSVTSILNAPKPSKKQINSNYSRLESMKSSDIDKISSNLSDQQNQSLSKVSSNLSKISFTSSMQRAVKRY